MPNVLEVSAIAATFVAVVLALVAIAQSLYFYNQSKNNEQRVSNALESIKTQTDALQKLTGRWMDRLTAYVTQPKQPDDTMLVMIRAITEIPQNIAAQLRAPGQDPSVPALVNEVVNAYLAIYFYACAANVTLQSWLPPIAELQEGDRFKQLVDQSYRDVRTMEGLISRFEQRQLESSNLYHLYAETQNWKPFIADATMVYQARASAGSAGA